MTIELDSSTYIVGFWFCSDPRSGNDWLCSVIRDPADGGWKGWYRFRYKKDDNIWDSEDEKSWYNFKPPGKDSEESIITSINNFQQIIRIEYPEHDKIIVQGDIFKLFTLSKGHDWMNIAGPGVSNLSTGVQ